MAKIKGAIVVDTERCKGCNLCVVACPLQVISLSKNVNVRGYNYAEQILKDTCNGCRSCAIVCPDGCISVYRVKVEETNKE
ncbi:MAG: 4Fe-4S binding protein [Bacteroidales bacterium]|nr:4Fe-4S binding protein [Bacteroidales bacterium]